MSNVVGEEVDGVGTEVSGEEPMAVGVNVIFLVKVEIEAEDK